MRIERFVPFRKYSGFEVSALLDVLRALCGEFQKRHVTNHGSCSLLLRGPRDLDPADARVQEAQASLDGVELARIVALPGVAAQCRDRARGRLDTIPGVRPP